MLQLLTCAACAERLRNEWVQSARSMVEPRRSGAVGRLRDGCEQVGCHFPTRCISEAAACLSQSASLCPPAEPRNLGTQQLLTLRILRRLPTSGWVFVFLAQVGVVWFGGILRGHRSLLSRGRPVGKKSSSRSCGRGSEPTETRVGSRRRAPHQPAIPSSQPSDH